MWRIQSRLEVLSNQAWEVVIDGDKGYDVIGTFSSWEEARNNIRNWLQAFIEGYVNPDTWGSEGASQEAVKEDAWALDALADAVEGKRWSFSFSHDDSNYTLVLQPI